MTIPEEEMRPSSTAWAGPRLAIVLLLSLATRGIAGPVETFVGFSNPIEEVSVAPDGTLYLPSPGPLGAVKRVTPDGTKSTLTIGIALPEGGTVDSSGMVYMSAWNSGIVHRIEPDGTTHTLATGLAGPTGQAISPDGQYLYVSQYSNNSIAKVDLSDGTWTTFVSGRGIIGPDGLAFDEQGRLYISNFLSSDILRADSLGNVTTIATLPGNRTGYCDYRNGVLYVAGNNSHRIYTVRPDGQWSILAGSGVAGHVDGPPSLARFDRPNGIAVSVTGDTLFVADNGTVRSVRRVLLTDPTGVVETLDGPRSGLELRLSPNPFTRDAEIAYTLPAAGAVSVSVYDAAGRRVRSLLRENRSSGRHVARWDGRGESNRPVAAGVYFVRLSWEGDETTARLVRRDD